jgi:hypothetical protein
MASNAYEVLLRMHRLEMLQKTPNPASSIRLEWFLRINHPVPQGPCANILTNSSQHGLAYVALVLDGQPDGRHALSWRTCVLLAPAIS